MKDRNGNDVFASNIVKVVSLPEIDLEPEERVEVNTMLNANFKIEQIQDGTAEMTKWFGKGRHSPCTFSLVK